jgi:hypothetical protein
LLAELTGTSFTSLTDQFFDRGNFFRTQFLPGVSCQHIVVLGSLDENAELAVWGWCFDVHDLRVEKVDNNQGSGRMRGRFPDFVVGKDAAAVRAKANDIRAANGQVHGARYQPY